MKRENDVASPDDIAAFIGLDWATEKHDICLRVAGSDKKEAAVIAQTPEGIADWVNQLRTRFEGRKVAVALEQTKGALIYALMCYDFIVLYPVHPGMLAKYRKAFASSGAKDDPTDADLILELLVKHRDKLRCWQPDDAATRRIALLTEGRRKAVNMRTALGNQLQAVLKAYYPQALQLAGKTITSPLACHFLLKWPCLNSVCRAHQATIRKFYNQQNCRSAVLIEKRLQLIKDAIPLTTDNAIIETSTLQVKLLANQLLELNKAITEYDDRLEKLFPEHPDSDIFLSLPGAGKVLAPRLLSAFGSDRSRFEDAQDIQAFSGIAPVLERSGKKQWVHWRYACSKYIRQSFHEFAALSILHSVWARSFYDQQRAKGKRHHTAVRSLAFKWIRIMFRCWKDCVPYDEVKYMRALQKRGSLLVAHLPQPG